MFAFPSAVLVVCYLINDPTNEPDKRWNNNISDKNWTEMFAVWESFITTTLIFICFFYTVVQKHCVKNPYLLKYLSTMCFPYRSYVVDNQSDLSVLSWRNQNVFMLEMLKKVTSITKLNRNGEFPAFGSIFNYPTILLVHLLDHYRVFVKWYYNKHTEWYFIYSYIHVHLPWWRFFNHYFNNKATTLHVHVYKPVHLALYLV